MLESEKIKEWTDLELVYKWCETCLDYVNPLLFRDIEQRGLYNIITHLPDNVEEAKAVAYSRMLKAKLVFGDDEIDYIADRIRSLEKLKETINSLRVTESHKLEYFLGKMLVINNEVLNYFKENGGV
jgi:hypothetical protein